MVLLEVNQSAGANLLAGFACVCTAVSTDILAIS
jgi:hypothetical protein